MGATHERAAPPQPARGCGVRARGVPPDVHRPQARPAAAGLPARAVVSAGALSTHTHAQRRTHARTHAGTLARTHVARPYARCTPAHAHAQSYISSSLAQDDSVFEAALSSAAEAGAGAEEGTEAGALDVLAKCLPHKSAAAIEEQVS